MSPRACCLELVPLLVSVLEHDSVRGTAEHFRFVGHARSAVLQLSQALAALGDSLGGKEGRLG